MVRTFDLSDDPAAPRERVRGAQKQRRRGRPKNVIDGWIVLDKPVGLTSTQALGAVKRLFDPDKAGHAGTLDPLASGMLPLALGEATKTVPFVVDGEKSYRFSLRWGSATDTDDADGAVIATSPVRPSREAIEAALQDFVGEVVQVPPRYSAIKVNGQRAYDLARGGEAVELAARTVTITRLALVAAGEDTVTLEADCGKGTYVRAIARDLGEKLGTCAHVVELRRTRVGPFGEADMVALEALRTLAEDPQAAIDAVLRPPADAVSGLASVKVDRNVASRLRRGQSAIFLENRSDGGDAPVRAMLGEELVALCLAQAGELQPTRVFRTPRRRLTVPVNSQGAS